MSDEYLSFRTVRRGYDPTEVEEVLDELYAAVDDAAKQVGEATEREKEQRAAAEALIAQLAAANDRLRALEAEPHTAVVPTYESLGTHIASILSGAEAEAAEIRERALREAELTRRGAQAAAEAERQETEKAVAGRLTHVRAKLQAEQAEHETALHRATEELASARDAASGIVRAARDEAERVRRESERWVADSQAHRQEVRGHIEQIRQLLVQAGMPQIDEVASAGPTRTP